MRKRSRRAVLAILAALLVSLAAMGSGALALIAVPIGALQFEADAGFAPKSLHKLRFTPGALRLSTRISTVDGSHPSPLKELIWEFDRNARFDVSGIPVCRPPIEQPPRPTLEEECEGAILGRGKAHMEILFEESTAIEQTSPLIVYNGGMRDGVHTLFAHAAITKPVPSGIDMEIRLVPVHSGRFRTAMVLTVPKIAGGSGSVAELSVRLGKQVVRHGGVTSFTSLRCTDDRIVTRARATFSDGTLLQVAPIQRPCAAR